MFENEFTWGNAIAHNATDVFHEQFEKAVEQVKNNLNKEYPLIINGKEIFSKIQFEVKSPSDTTIIVAKFPKGTANDTNNAIKSAKDAFFEWSNTPYQTRAKIFKECADLFSKQKFRLSAIMSFENGKTRIEAIGDVDEAIDFMIINWKLIKDFQKKLNILIQKKKLEPSLNHMGYGGLLLPLIFHQL